MTKEDNTEAKNAEEIESLVKQLNQANQLNILNTVNAFLYSQQIEREKKLKDDLQGG